MHTYRLTVEVEAENPIKAMTILHEEGLSGQVEIQHGAITKTVPFFNPYSVSAHELANTFSGQNEHPLFTRENWKQAVNEGRTALGYIDWLRCALQAAVE